MNKHNNSKIVAIILAIAAVVSVWKITSKDKSIKVSVEAKFDRLENYDNGIFDDTSKIRKICIDSVIDPDIIDTVSFVVENPYKVLYYVEKDVQSYIIKDVKDSTCCKGPLLPAGTIIELQDKEKSGLYSFAYHGIKIWLFENDVKYLSGDEFEYISSK